MSSIKLEWANTLDTYGQQVDADGKPTSLRYVLRQWEPRTGSDPRRLLFLLLAPIRGERLQDEVYRQCAGFARMWGYVSFEAVFLYPELSDDPRKDLAYLCETCDEDAFEEMIERVEGVLASSPLSRVVAAWGSFFDREVHKRACQRSTSALNRFSEHLSKMPRGRVQCLGLGALGEPHAPLSVSLKAPLEPFTRRPHWTPKKEVSMTPLPDETAEVPALFQSPPSSPAGQYELRVTMHAASGGIEVPRPPFGDASWQLVSVVLERDGSRTFYWQRRIT